MLPVAPYRKQNIYTELDLTFWRKIRSVLIENLPLGVRQLQLHRRSYWLLIDIYEHQIEGEQVPKYYIVKI